MPPRDEVSPSATALEARAQESEVRTAQVEARATEAEARAARAEARATAAEARAAAVEARLAEAEARAAAGAHAAHLEATLTVTDIGVWHWDIQRDTITGDRNLARLFGVPEGEPSPLGAFVERMHPADRARVGAAIGRAVETGAAYDEEYRVRRPDGTVRWVHARGRAQRDPTGRPVAFPGVAIDVTARKHGEARLHASEERYRKLVESVDEGFCVLELLHDPDGRLVDARCLEVNPAAERITGFHGAVGRTIREVLPTIDSYWLAFFEEVVRSGAPVRIERYSEELGHWFTVHALRLGAPEAPRVALLFSDITERKRADARLRESEERLRSVLEASPFPAMIHADDGEVVALNAAWSRRSGYRPEQVPTIDAWAARAYGDHAARVLEHIRRGTYQLQAMTPEGEFAVVTAGGDTLIWDFFSGPIGVDPRGRRLILSTASDVTERHRAEQALRESRQRLARLFDTNLLGILYWDLGGAVHDANDEFLRIVGYTRADLEAGTIDWIALTPEEYRTRDAVAVAQLRAHGAHAPVEKEYLRKDGSRVWVLVGSATIDGGRGVGFVLDIQASKQAEAALRESEARTRRAAAQAESERRLLDAILDAAPVGIVVADAAGKILRTNPANDGIWGQAPDVSTPDEYGSWKGWWADGSARDGHRVRREEWAMSRALRGESAREDVVRIEPFGRPGTYRTILNSGASVRDADGHIVGAVVAQMDVTAWQEAERRLREREQRLRYALEATRTVTWEQPRDSDVVTRSDTSFDVLGLPPAGTRAEFLAAVHPEDRDVLRDGVARALAGEIPYEFAFRMVRPDTGAVRWFLERGLVERDAEGRFLEARGLLTDITERRQAEEQARAAQRMEAVGRLAGGVAHEINNALSGVIAFSGLALRRMGADDPVRRYIEQIARAGDRAAAVTRQLLAFGRRQVLQSRDTDIASIVLQFEPMLRQALGPEKELSLACRGPAVANVDPVQIEQVLLNLVLNARDAMAYGGRLEIGVDVERDREVEGPAGAPGRRGPWVRLTVSDDGAGMPPETLAHLFEPFFTTKPLGKGTGLGLATVYGIVQQSNGHIHVDSEPGRGTTFEILLPCSAEHAPEAARVPEVASAAPTRRFRVLVVDDEPIVRRAVVATLESEGYAVVGAASVAEAIRAIAEATQSPDLVITDVVMPGESGAELARRLGASHPEVPVLFISGYTGDEAARRGLLPLGARMLEKPFTFQALLAKVAEMLATTVVSAPA